MKNKKYILLFALVGVFLLLSANNASAAVTGTSTAMATATSTTPLRANQQVPVLMLNLSANATESLNSVIITIATTTNATPTAFATSSLNVINVWKDMNNNGTFDAATDTIIGTSTVASIGGTTTINTNATTATGVFFITVQTAGTSTFTDNGSPDGQNASATAQRFVVQMSTSTGVVASSTNATLTGANTTYTYIADTHSQQPVTNNILPQYASGSYNISAPNGAGEAGTLNVYNTSTSTTPMATTTLSPAGGFGSVNLGTTYYPTIWLDANDAAGNATSSRASLNLSNYKPTVTSFNAFSNRIIMNISKSLRGDQASNCGNYTLNGSTLSCTGGPSSPYINFMGNQLTVQNLTLSTSTTVSFSVATGTIQDSNSDQFPLSFATSGVAVQAGSVPTISSVSPGSGAAGTSVTITGSNFGSATGTVLFSGGFSQTYGPQPPVQASTTAWSSTSITAVVPAGAQSGPVQVSASTGMMSDMNQNTFFDVVNNFYVKLYQTSTSTAIATSTSMRLFIGDKNGENVRYDGDASGTTFNASNNVYTLSSVSSQGFIWAYDVSGARLPAPGAPIQSNTSSSSPQALIFSATTTYNVSGTTTLGTSCTSTFGGQNVAVLAMPQGTSIQMGPGGAQPSFFITSTSTCAVSYALALPATGTYNVQAHRPPSSSATGLLDPAGQTVIITASSPTSTANFTFTSASRSIYGRVVGANGNALSDPSKYNDLWVNAYQPIAGGQGTAARPDSSGYFRLYAQTGAYKISIGGPGMPMGVEQSVFVSTSTAFDAAASTPVVTLTLAPPSGYIEGYVKDSTGNAISGTDVFSYCSNGPGGGHSVTDSQGYYKMYVPPCTNYHVNGFSSSYGQLTEQSNINAGSGGVTVNFTINSSNFVTISGTVNQNGSPVSAANVWITQGSFGPGVAGGQSNSSGVYSLRVKSGLSNLYVHAAVMGQGELANQQVANGSTVTTDQANVNASSSVATLSIYLYPGNTFSQVFLGAHSNNGGGFTNTAVATSTSYDTYQIQLPYSGAGTAYTIEGGIMNFGPLPTATTTISGNATTSINLNSINYYTVSGSVSGSYSGAFVWAGGTAGGGNAQVDSSGNFSMMLRQGTYDFGVNKDGYLGSVISQRSIATTTAGLSLSLTQSASTITGTAYYNGSALSGVRVWAENAAGGWAGAQTNANGAFTLSVSPGDWRVHAIADGYQLPNPIVVTAPATSISLNMSAVSFVANQLVQSITQGQSGVVQTTSTKVQIPTGAFTDANVQVTISDTMATPQKTGTRVIGTGQSISATYSSGSKQGQPVTQLAAGTYATVQFVLTKAQLIANGITGLSQLNNMQIGYDDSNTNLWTYITPTVTASSSDGSWTNLTSVTFSGNTSHFSNYALVSPMPGATASTSGVTASAGDGQVTISWSSVGSPTYYEIYRYQQSDATYPFLASTTATSYTNQGLTNGSTYSYKVSAMDSNGNESAASAAVSATPAAAASSNSSTPSGGAVIPGNLGDTTPPSISDIRADVRDTGATVSWKTDESSISWLVYGTSTAYGSELKTVALATSHSLTITGISPSTTYHYQVKAKDSSNNTSSYTDKTFTTLAAGQTAPTPIPTPTPQPRPTIKPISQMTTQELKAEIGRLVALIAQVQARLISPLAAPITPSAPTGFQFKKNLLSGKSDADVVQLKTVLVQEGCLVDAKKTKLFGSKTVAGVKCFCQKYKTEISRLQGSKVKCSGIVGKGVRAKLNQIINSTPSPVPSPSPSPTPTVSPSPSLSPSPSPSPSVTPTSSPSPSPSPSPSASPSPSPTPSPSPSTSPSPSPTH